MGSMEGGRGRGLNNESCTEWLNTTRVLEFFPYIRLACLGVQTYQVMALPLILDKIQNLLCAFPPQQTHLCLP